MKSCGSAPWGAVPFNPETPAFQVTWQGKLPKISQASYTPQGPEAIHDLSLCLHFQVHSGCGGGWGCAQHVPPAVCVCPRSAALQRNTAAGISLGLDIHTGANPNIWICFLANCPAGKFWYYNGVSALIWREVIFLSALLIS